MHFLAQAYSGKMALTNASVAVPRNAPCCQQRLLLEPYCWNFLASHRRNCFETLRKSLTVAQCALFTSSRGAPSPLKRMEAQRNSRKFLKQRYPEVSCKYLHSRTLEWDSQFDLPEDANKYRGLWPRIAPYLPVSLRNKELFIRILGTVFLASMCRVGEYVHVPGLGVSALASQLAAAGHGEAVASALGLSTRRTTLYALGIGPLVNASWTISVINLIKWPPNLYYPLNQSRQEGRMGMNRIKRNGAELCSFLCSLIGT
eukprot:jgi/Botrbrau1/10702/Bobra.357_1s0006.2